MLENPPNIGDSPYHPKRHRGGQRGGRHTQQERKVKAIRQSQQSMLGAKLKLTSEQEQHAMHPSATSKHIQQQRKLPMSQVVERIMQSLNFLQILRYSTKAQFYLKIQNTGNRPCGHYRKSRHQYPKGWHKQRG